MAESSRIESFGFRAGDGRSLPKPNNIIPIEADSDTDFFLKWCSVLNMYIKLTTGVKLTERDSEVISCMLKYRLMLQDTILDHALLDSSLMGADIQNKVMEECHMTMQHFYVVKSNLKAKGIIKDGILDPRLIPNTRKDDNGVFQLLILFRNTNK